MKIVLMSRHYGVHTPVRSAFVEGEFSVYGEDDGCDGYKVDEAKLLSVLPEGFLPTTPDTVLLSVIDETGGTGLRGLTHFRNWSKYYDAYVLSLSLDE